MLVSQGIAVGVTLCTLILLVTFYPDQMGIRYAAHARPTQLSPCLQRLSSLRSSL